MGKFPKYPSRSDDPMHPASNTAPTESKLNHLENGLLCNIPLLSLNIHTVPLPHIIYFIIIAIICFLSALREYCSVLTRKTKKNSNDNKTNNVQSTYLWSISFIYFALFIKRIRLRYSNTRPSQWTVFVLSSRCCVTTSLIILIWFKVSDKNI